jgi:hypothetical protein
MPNIRMDSEGVVFTEMQVFCEQYPLERVSVNVVFEYGKGCISKNGYT